jgi:hypothetical protein
MAMAIISRRAFRTGLAATVAVAALLGTPAAHAAPVSLSVWSGGHSSFESPRGVVIQPNGQGTILGAPRRGGKSKKTGTFKPSATQLSAIRQAAQAVFKEKRLVFHNKFVGEESYALATVQVGKRRDGVVAIGDAPQSLVNLFAALNAAVPPSARVATPAGAVPVLRQARAAVETPQLGGSFGDLPDVAPCPPGQRATNVSKQISLQDAAAAGMLTLTSKGGFNDDVVAVDATWRNVGDAPVHIGTNVEFVETPGTEGQTARIVQEIQDSVAGLKTSSGQPVTVDINFKVRAPGSAPTPCFHEVALTNDNSIHPNTGHITDGVPDTGGVWNVNGFKGMPSKYVDTHEFGHIMGLPDAYQLFLELPSGEKVWFEQGETGYDQQSAIDYVKELKDAQGNPQFDPAEVDAGQLKRFLPDDHRHDIMGGANAAPDSKFIQSDIDKLAASATAVDIHADSGTILANKTLGEQNLVVAGPFDLHVQPGKPAHADGMAGYCLDLHRNRPVRGSRFDVAGKTGALADPAMQAVQRVLDVAERHQTHRGGGSAFAFDLTVDGGQEAVWRITDDDPPGDEGKALLQEAGISTDTEAQKFNASHIDDPNAGSPETASVTPTGVNPAKPFPTTPLPKVRPAKPRLLRARLVGAKPTSRARRARLRVEMIVDRADAVVSATLQRRLGRRARTLKRFKARKLFRGFALIALTGPRLSAGKYQLVFRDRLGSKRVLRFNVR